MQYTLQVKDLDGSGDLYIELPPELLSSMGWDDGTVLEWVDNHDGTYTLKECND